MSERAFPLDSVDRGGQKFSAYRIECSKCDAKELFTQSKSRNLPRVAAEQSFRNHGWHVGNGPRADVCPNCQKKGRPALKVVKSEDAPKADPPRAMSPADRRIITEKLDEVYDEKGSAYRSPWTDSAVSRDLGVPRAWVGEVREQFFGPEGSNPDIDAFMEAAAPIITDMKNMFRALHGQVEAIKAIEPRISEIERIGRKIEREMGR